MRYRIVSRLIGLLLLTAAGLKIYGIHADPVARVGWFSGIGIQALVIQFEIVLGLWLLSGFWLLASWLVAVATFTGFAAFSFHGGWIGQASCGCFGKIALSPWYALALDLVVLVALLIWHPELLRASTRINRREAVLTATGICAALIALAPVLYLGFGSPTNALAMLRGERLSLNPDFVDLGAGDSGEVKETRVELVNRADRPIRIIGGTADCSCTLVEDLPLILNPGEKRSIAVEVRMPTTPGLFTRTAFLLADDQGLKRVPLQISGRVN